MTATMPDNSIRQALGFGDDTPEQRLAKLPSGELYKPHHCEDPWGEVSPRIDACTHLAQLDDLWMILAANGDVDMIGGAEYAHAVSHLAWRLQQDQAGGRP